MTSSAVPGAADLLRQAVFHLEHNDLSQAERLLSRLLSAEPANPEALRLLGLLRQSEGRLDEAEKQFRRAIAANSAPAAPRFNLGNLLLSLERFEEAAAELRAAVRATPNFAEAHLSLALAQSKLGDHAAAEKSCRAALRCRPDYLLATECLASELNRLERPEEAEQILRPTLLAGVRDAQQAAELEHVLGVSLKQQGRLTQALELFDDAQSKCPGVRGIDYDRADTLQQLGRVEEAFHFYTRALAQDPDNADVLACLSFMAARLGDFGAARGYGARAIEINPQQEIAQVALTMADVALGNAEPAEPRLQRLLDNAAVGGSAAASFALGFVADLLDRRGMVDEAFTIYTESNNRLRKLYEVRFGKQRAVDTIRRQNEYFKACTRWPATRAEEQNRDGAGGHVFLLGFMRSGTTLLQTILAGHRGVCVSDEIEYLAGAARTFLSDDTALDRLSAMGGAEAAKWRAAYWQSVRNARNDVCGKLFVDKIPFNSLRLPLISCIFPRAKVLLAIRDPRDVVLSCFRRRFNVTNYSFEFLRLEECARFYAATMSLIVQARSKLALSICECRYEDIILDFDHSIKKICKFVELGWTDSLRDFRAAAQTVDRRSASAEQVRRGLYTDGAGQWRRYREQLAPVLPLLEPWVAHFGYPAE